MSTGYLTLFDVSGNGLGMASAATSITTENRSLTVGSGTLTAATGTFTNVGGTLTTVSQPNVTTLGGVTSLNSITVGAGTLSGLTSVAATTGTFTNVGGTLTTVSQPNVTTLGGVTSIASLLTISGSQLGIGTSPSEKLHVSVGNVEGIRIQSTNCGALKFYTDSGNTDNRNWMIAQNYNANGDFNIMSSSSAGGAPTANTCLHIDRASNIGISNSAPNCLLDIGNVRLNGANVYELHVGRSDTSSAVRVGQDATHSMVFGWGYNATASSAYGAISCYGASNNLVLQEGGASVGIGTTSPLCTLAIGAGSISDANVPLQLSAAGATKYIGVNRTNGNYGALFGWDVTWGATVRSVNASDNLVFVVNSTTAAMTITPTSGNIGIGTASIGTQTRLHVYEGGSETSVWRGRGVFSGATNAALIGTYNGLALVGAHNAALNAWATLYLNHDGSTAGNNVIMCGSAGAGVGITTTSLTGYKLRIAGDVRLNGVGNFGVYIETALGTTAGTAVACASFASDAIYSSNVGTITNAYNVFIGTGITGGTITNGYSLYVQDPAYGSTKVCAYFANQVGIAGNPVSTHKLSVTGTAYLSTGTAWTTSDARIKTDIRDIDSAIDVIERLRPRKFKYREEWVNDATGVNATDDYYGFIADEVEMVMPECVELKTGLHCFNGRKILHRQREEAKMRAKKEEVAIEEKEEPVDPEPEPEKGFENLKNFSMHNIIVVTIAAVKQLTAMFRSLDDRLDALSVEVAEIKRRL